MIRIKEAKRDIADNLWDELIVVGQVRSAVNAAVGAMAVWQVGLEGFGARHGDRGGRDGVGAEQKGRSAQDDSQEKQWSTQVRAVVKLQEKWEHTCEEHTHF